MDQKNQSRRQKSTVRAAANQPRAPRQAPAGGSYQPNPRRARDEEARRRQAKGLMRRRRRRMKLFTMLIGLVLAVTGLVLAVTVLFKVTGYRVENPTGAVLSSVNEAGEPMETADLGPYTEQQIIDALAVSVGDNIFGFSAEERELLISRSLPELDTVKVRRSLPGTVVVQATPATAAYTVAYGAQWAVLSESCKVMRIEASRPAGLVELQGIEASMADPGVRIQLAAAPDPAATSDATVSDTTPDEALELLLAELETNGLLDGLTAVQLGDLNEFSFTYEDRLKVLLGTSNNLDYKIRLTARVVLAADGLSATDRGTLDVSHMNDGGTINPVFSPGSIE
ncbi:MAG: FtsQ-type POTRA domain-containing protein [Oscillospiraceae bacterium]|nr:FtsQ-type POTRA domain-containing protein [Oscillospiraceae bacterium]